MTKKIVIMGLIFWSGFFMVLPFRLSAQTAVKLETLLNETELSWSAATAFVLEASDTGAYSDPLEAFSFAQEHKWLPKNVCRYSDPKPDFYQRPHPHLCRPGRRTLPSRYAL